MSCLFLLALFAQHCFAAQLDLLPINADDLDQKLIALFQLISNVANAVFSHLADVQQAIRAGKDFNESAEIRQPNHFAQIDLAHFGFGRYVLDHLDGFVGRGFVG